MKKMLFILGDEIAKVTGLQAVHCRGLMRMAAQDQCGSNNPLEVDAYIEKLDFRRWQTLLEDSGFCQRLANMGVKDVSMALAHARRTLVEKQSLFTLAAR